MPDPARRLNASGAPLLQTTLAYDSLVAIPGYGDVLETASTNLLGHVSCCRIQTTWPDHVAMSSRGMPGTASRRPSTIPRDGCCAPPINSATR